MVKIKTSKVVISAFVLIVGMASAEATTHAFAQELPEIYQQQALAFFPSLDKNGEGFSIWQEYWAGTDPRDSNSFLRIDTVLCDGTNVVLEWRHAQVDAAIPPLAVERSLDLSSGAWSTIGEKTPVDGTNRWTGALLDSALYRLSVTNAP